MPKVTSKVELTIGIKLANFDGQRQRLLKFAIAGFLEVSPDDVEIIKVEEGSVKVTIEIPSKSVERLLNAIKTDDPEILSYLAPVISTRREGQSQEVIEIGSNKLSIRLLEERDVSRNRDAQYDAIIKNMLEKRSWALVRDLEKFSSEVIAEAHQRMTINRPFEQEVTSAVVNRYTIVLYEACAGTDRERQQRAFQELARHLDRVAAFRGHPPDLVVEFRTRALRKILVNLKGLRDRGAFLEWCNGILLHEITDYQRASARLDTELSTLIEEEATDERVWAELPYLRAAEAGFQETGRDELRERLTGIIDSCLKNAKQRQVIVEIFLNEKTLLQVAEEMELTPSQIKGLQYRAARKLRKCEDFHRLYQEWLA